MPVVHKLSDAEMVRRYEAGEVMREIAAAADCSINTVWRKLKAARVRSRTRGNKGSARDR